MLGTRSIWCSIPLIGGKPLRTSSGNTSKSCNKETAILERQGLSLLVFKCNDQAFSSEKQWNLKKKNTSHNDILWIIN